MTDEPTAPVTNPTDSVSSTSATPTAMASSTSANVASPTEHTSIATPQPTAAPSGTPGGESDLPEWEPLTPELVEDEAIRGDFMLRWAAILLALLLGCRQIADPQTLVRIRTGEYLASHGIFPPRSDVFSYTATERPWVNLGWLFDLVVAGVHRVGGPALLSALVGIATAAMFYWIVHLSRPKLPTWWHAVCAGVLLLATWNHLVALPTWITLLGMAWCLRSLDQWQQQRRPGNLWCVVGTLVIWSNMDSRAYFGGLLLLGFGIGSEVAQRSQRGDILLPEQRQLLWKAVGAGWGALLLNPFGWRAWLSPITHVLTELPWLRANENRVTDLGFHPWKSLLDIALWRQPTASMVAAAVLIVMAVVTTVMNRRRVHLGLLVAVVLVTAIGCVSWGDLAPALVAVCVLAAINGQEWYRDHCRQDYTIEWRELLFSRAGRAVTVVALGVLAYVAISGRLAGRTGARIGFGWTPQLAANIRDVESDLKDFQSLKASNDDDKSDRDKNQNGRDGISTYRIFQFRMDQGDLMIWAGIPVFFDSRVALYASGTPNVLDEQDAVRTALRSPAVGTTDESDRDRKAAANEILERYKVTHLAPRLWGYQPGYGSMISAIQSGDWQLARLAATTALFERKPAAKAPAKSTALDFVDLCFRQCRAENTNPARVLWPQPQTGYQRFLSLKPLPVSNAGQRARHYIELLQADRNGQLQMTPAAALALAHLAIRDSQAALYEDANNVSAYISLADAYSVLEAVETRINAVHGIPGRAQQRVFQSLAALHQALILDPSNVSLRLSLIGKYRSMNRLDSTLAETQTVLTTLVQRLDLTEQDIITIRQLRELSDQIKPVAERVEEAINEARQKDADKFALAVSLQQQGFSKRALELLETDKLQMSGNVQASLNMAILMADVGRLDEANSMFEGLDQLVTGSEPLYGAWQVQAAYVAMGRGDYDRAVAWCSKQRNALSRASMEAVLSTIPMRSKDLPLIATKSVWPTSLVAASQHVLFNIDDQKALLYWVEAVSRLESGKCNEAKSLLKDLIKYHPGTMQAPLARVYLELLTNEPQVLNFPGDEVPILFEE